MAAPMTFMRCCQFHAKMLTRKIFNGSYRSFYAQKIVKENGNLRYFGLGMNNGLRRPALSLTTPRNNPMGQSSHPRVLTLSKMDHPNLTLHLKYTFGFSIMKKSTDSSKHPGHQADSRFIWGLMAAGLFSFGKKEKETEEDELIRYILLAHEAEHHRDYGRADKMYHQALDILQDRASSGKMTETEVVEAQVRIYDNMANLALASTRLDQAEKLFKEALRGMVQMEISQDDNAVVEISLKLAMIYVMQQRYKEAHAGYKFCIETQERKLEQQEGPPDDNSLALLGMCVNSYARFHIMEKHYKEASITLEKAIDIARRVFGESHPQLAVLISDLATIASLSNDYVAAKQHASQSVAIGQKSDSPDLAALYCNMCAIYMEAGDLKEARQYCKEAKLLAMKIGDKETQSEAEECLQEINKKLK